MELVMLGLLDVMNIDFAKIGETLMLVGLFLLSLDVVVMFHELGHFIMAKRAGIRVEVFSVGMGKRLFGFKVGETDFRFSLLPIGGYVKMAGQEDFAPLEDGDTDPDSFANKSVGARFGVIAAGVIMNVIFGFVVFSGLAMTGIDWFNAPIVGGVIQGYPADTAVIQWDDGAPDSEGFLPGDRILTINGKTIESFQQVRIKSILAGETSTYDFTIARAGRSGTQRIGSATLGVRYADGGTGTGSKMLSFGIAPANTLTAAQPDGLIVGTDVIPAGQTVVAVNGTPVEYESDLIPIMETLTDEPVVLTLLMPDDTTRTVTHTPTMIMTGRLLNDGRYIPADELWPDFSVEKPRTETRRIWRKDDGTEEVIETEQFISAQFDVLGLQPRLRVMTVQEGSRANKVGVLPGDIVLSYGGEPLPTLQEFLATSSVFAGQTAELLVDREGTILEPIQISPKRKKNGVALVGTVMGTDQSHLVIANMREGSPAETAAQNAGLSQVTGWAITSMGESGTVPSPSSMNTWPQLVETLSKLQADGATSARLTTASLPASAKGFFLPLEQFEPEAYEYFLFDVDQAFEPLKAPTIRYRNPFKAMWWGLDQTGQQVLMGYQQFGSLFMGTVSTKELKGPVGIGGIAVKTAKMGPARFVFFMGFLSIMLAIVNFLPLPVVDGGHALFLLVEKIRGKPMSPKAMNVIQFIGLAALLGLILLLTFNDIVSLILNAW
jgi:regulator of sigma E protease